MTEHERVAINKRIENGDIFFRGTNKGKCHNCEAVIDADSDNYCWKCGAKLNHL